MDGHRSSNGVTKNDLERDYPTPICVKPTGSFTDLLHQFAERTSCVGPGFIASSQTWNKRILWMAFFLAAFAATVYITYLNFAEFNSYNTRSSISIGFSPLRFPTVSICNSNPIRRSAIDMATTTEFWDFLTKLDPMNKDFQSDIYWSDVYWNETYWNTSTSDTADYYDEYYDDYQHRKKDPRSQVMEEFNSHYQSETSNTKLMMGHDIEHMLVSCSYAGRQCSTSDFEPTLSPEYGVCYSFNSDRANNLTSYKSGNAYGLKLILYLENHEYISGLTSNYGARIVVTQNGALPLPEKNGLYLSAGAETDLGLKLVNISRLGEPHGKCFKSMNSTNYGGYTWPYIYSRQACQYTCFAIKTYEICNCFLLSQLHLYPSEVLDNYDLPPCSYDETKVKCVIHLATNRYGTDDNVTCDCPNPCWEPTYDSILSSTDWPTNDYVTALEKVICNSPDQSEGCQYLQELPMSDKRRNFLKVNVFYRDLNFEDIKEEADYPASKFYSDLGGSIGLFLGLSVLSLVEIVDFVFEILGWSLQKLFGQSPKEEERSKQTHRENINGNNQPFSYTKPMPEKEIPTVNRILAPVRYTDMTFQRV